MTDFKKNRSYNRLVHSDNPYLLQHVDNPIHWWSWEEAALREAQNQDRPLFISIGYSTCHWCHVMARESFSDQEVADKLNRHFVSIKIDREEHPQIDSFYINAARMMGVQGGWPLSVFADWEAKPFFIGTYFPPYSSQGVSFTDLLNSIIEAWEQNKNQILANSEKIYQLLKDHFSFDRQKTVQPIFSQEHLEFFGEDKEFLDLHEKYFDRDQGGFKFQAHNKFPCLMNLSHLLKIYRREGRKSALSMVEQTVSRMMLGGIYDQIGGGLYRYSTDYSWRLPHFEKMLYDNALLLDLLGDLYALTAKESYRKWAYEVIDYYEREMKDKKVFLSAEDADSEGKEGVYYLWTYEEIEKALVKQSKLDQTLFKVMELYFGLSQMKGGVASVLTVDKSIFEISQILSLSPKKVESLVLRGKNRLMEEREKRTKPFKDKKMITAWNGLMIASYAKLAHLFQDPKLSQLAIQGLQFYKNFYAEHKTFYRYLMEKEGRIVHSKTVAHLNDWAAIVWAALRVYQLSLKDSWKAWSLELTIEVMNRFKVEQVLSEVNQEHDFLLDKMVEFYDGVEPCGNSIMAQILVRLDLLFPEKKFSQQAENIFKMFYQHLSGTELPFMLSGFHSFKEGLDFIEITLDKKNSEFNSRFQSELEELKVGIGPHFLVDLKLGNTMDQGLSVKICLDKTCYPPMSDLKKIKQIIKDRLELKRTKIPSDRAKQ